MDAVPSDEGLLDHMQRAAFGYFLQALNPANGLIADTSRENSPCSIAVVGFALSAYPVAVEHGWMTRADAVDRSLAALRFFQHSDQSGSPEATGCKGFYYHFLDMHTAVRVWRSELSMIDTAALASLPFAPEIAWCAARNMLHRYPEMLSAEQYASSFNPTLASADRGAWVSAGHFGLDQGIVVMMIENHRTQLIWRLMRDCPYVVTGLRRAGFRGGWL